MEGEGATYAQLAHSASVGEGSPLKILENW